LPRKFTPIWRASPSPSSNSTTRATTRWFRIWAPGSTRWPHGRTGNCCSCPSAAPPPPAAPPPAITLTRQDGWSWSCRQADRTQYDGAEAQWHDPATGQRRTHKTGGTNRKRLKRTYASQAEAKQAATAEAARRARSKRTFTYELAMANMQLQPNAPITLAGWTTAIDAASWLIESVETAMGANGLKQRVELQSA
jgi:phage protein D